MGEGFVTGKGFLWMAGEVHLRAGDSWLARIDLLRRHDEPVPQSFEDLAQLG